MKFTYERKQIFSALEQIYNKTEEKAEEALIILRGPGNTDTILVSSLNNKTSSNSNHEIKIPNKYKIDTTVIWDCQDLEITTELAQGLINRFFIKRLSETTTKLKFIVLTSESSVIEKSSDFLSILDFFTSIFTISELEKLKNSLSLVITNAQEPNNFDRAVYDIVRKREEFKKFLEDLFSPISIKILTSQSKLVPVKILIEDFNDLQAASVEINPLPLRLKDYEELRKVYFLINVNIAAITDFITLTFNEKNFHYYQPLNCQIFFDNYNTHIQKFLLGPCKNYTSSTLEKPKHFQGLQQIFEFQDLIEKNNENTILPLLDIIEKFVEAPEQQEQIHNYSYIFKLFNKHLNALTENFPNALIVSAIDHCKTIINEIATPFIKKIELMEPEDVNSELDYYETAIRLLEQYPQPQEINKTTALAHFYKGEIYSKKREFFKAAEEFIKALSFNKELKDLLYKKIGDTLFELSDRLELNESNKVLTLAIKYYDAAGQTSKGFKCYDKLIENNQEHPEFLRQKGDYLLTKKYYCEALDCYDIVKSKTGNLAQRNEIVFEELECYEIMFKERPERVTIIDESVIHEQLTQLITNNNHDLYFLGSVALALE
ncbi:tetratricopeptide repeat protein [Rickettsia endosymbiont of Halotydeus destructor]|uniref:tetratricopeptide repeat protein n=1 Tax=Rickettsia endosymbiont of Halotydeus destructor TaxID=2996754 RepID=UPI003BAFA1FC